MQLIIIDTAGPACGGEPESAQAAIQFFMAARSIPVTSLILAHKSKNIESRGPFGSVYWSNYPRNVYNLRGSQEEDSSITNIALIHEKSNDGRLQRPLGMKMEFSEDGNSMSCRPHNVSHHLLAHFMCA